MRNLISVTLSLLWSLCWISVSGSEFRTVEVQSGEEVTLLCSNFSTVPSQIIWFRVVKRSKLHCIAFMFDSVSYCDGFKNGKFGVSSNMTTVFLRIKSLNSSDSGLYFCGYYIFNNKPIIMEATNLEVQEASQELTYLMSVILGALSVFLVVIVISLVIKIKKLEKGALIEEREPNETQRQCSDDLNYAAVTFHPKTERLYIHTSDREVDTNVIYSATK